MTGLLARTCRTCQKRDVYQSFDRNCFHCRSPLGRFQLGLDQLMDPNEAEAPAWPLGASATKAIRRAVGLE